MRRAIVGRDEVVTRVWQQLTRPGSVLLEGPAGIGKTAVWRALVDRARQAGWLAGWCSTTPKAPARVVGSARAASGVCVAGPGLRWHER